MPDEALSEQRGRPRNAHHVDQSDLVVGPVSRAAQKQSRREVPPAVRPVAPDLAVNRHAREEDRVVRALARGLDLGRSAVAGEYASWKINLHRGRHGPGHLLTNLLGRIVRGPVADRLAGLLREVLHDVPAGENAAGLRGAFIRLHVREPQALLLLEFGPQGVGIGRKNRKRHDDAHHTRLHIGLDPFGRILVGKEILRLLRRVVEPGNLLGAGRAHAVRKKKPRQVDAGTLIEGAVRRPGPDRDELSHRMPVGAKPLGRLDGILRHDDAPSPQFRLTPCNVHRQKHRSRGRLLVFHVHRAVAGATTGRPYP